MIGTGKVDIKPIVDEISDLIEEGKVEKVGRILKQLSPQDIVDILLRLDEEKRRTLAALISNDKYVQILAKLPEEVLLDVIKVIGITRLAKIAPEIPPDELADIIEKLPPYYKRQILRELPYWKLEEVKPLLGYPPETAGGVMTTRIPIFNERQLVAEVIKEFSIKNEFGYYDKSNYIYVIDDEGKLKGWIDVKSLFTIPRDKKIGEVTLPCRITVNALADREEAARLVIRYDLTEIPVVDLEGRLLGAITVDDIIDVIVAESSEDLLKFGGLIQIIKGAYLTAKITELVKKRATWLIVLYLMESITITVISNFRDIISAVVALSFFIPLLTGTAGNAGSQSATLVIRSLAIGEARTADFLRVILKESISAFLLGLILAPAGFMIAMATSRDLLVSLSVSLTLVLVILIASLIGVSLPFIALKIKADPAVVSAPLLTTLTDVLGLSTYFIIATYLLGLR